MSSDELNHVSHWEKSCEGLCRVSGGEEWGGDPHFGVHGSWPRPLLPPRQAQPSSIPPPPRAVWPQHLPCRGTRGWGRGLARSLGSHHRTEVAPARGSEAWGAQAPSHTHAQSRSLASRRWLQKAALGQEGSHKLKLYLSPGWTASSDLLALAFRTCFQKAPNWVYWNMRKISGLVICNFWGDCVLLPDFFIFLFFNILFFWWKYQGICWFALETESCLFVYYSAFFII